MRFHLIAMEFLAFHRISTNSLAFSTNSKSIRCIFKEFHLISTEFRAVSSNFIEFQWNPPRLHRIPMEFDAFSFNVNGIPCIFIGIRCIVDGFQRISTKSLANLSNFKEFQQKPLHFHRIPTKFIALSSNLRTPEPSARAF